jgi:hypothetical protein
MRELEHSHRERDAEPDCADAVDFAAAVHEPAGFPDRINDAVRA